MKTRWNRMWQIVYPILAYYLCYNAAYLLLMFLFGGLFSNLFWLGIASLCTIPVILRIYKTLPIVFEPKQLQWQKLPVELAGIFGVVVVGVLLNVLISQTPLVQLSDGYVKANATLYSGGIWVKIFANCITIPILEELVYRGIVCKQLYQWYGTKLAVFVSALLFGLMHFNMVQCLYGFLVGAVLAFVYLKTSRLWVVMVAHGLTNFTVLFFTTIL
jgi:hypothetical protein